MIKKIIAASAAIVGIAGAGTAQAYKVDYGHSASADSTVPLTSFPAALDARNAFFAGGMPAVQDFENITAGTSGPLSLTFGSGDSAVVATLSGTGGKVVQVGAGLTDEGRFSVGVAPSSMGSKFWETKATSEGSTFELWFDNPVVKFGFFGIDVGDFDGVLELEILGGTAGSSEVIKTLRPTDAITGDAADGSVLYFGVTAADSAEWFRGVRFRSFGPARTTVSDDVFAFDSFTVVAAPRGTGPDPVPAPGTVALLGAALAALALVRRRR